LGEIDRDKMVHFIESDLQLDRGTLALLYNGGEQESEALPEGFTELTNYQEILNTWGRQQPYKHSAEM
jgi:hypothetical protein